MSYNDGEGGSPQGTSLGKRKVSAQAIDTTYSLVDTREYPQLSLCSPFHKH